MPASHINILNIIVSLNELFNNDGLKYFRKILRLRCLTEFWVRLCQLLCSSIMQQSLLNCGKIRKSGFSNSGKNKPTKPFCFWSY